MTETTQQLIVQNRTVITLVLDDPSLSFNEYVRHRCLTGSPINGDREAFHSYLRGLGKYHYSMTAWDMWWDRFVDSQTAADEQRTMADALI